MLYIITEYFYPFSDAGGPVRSIENILRIIKNDIKLITSANSHQGDCLSGYVISDCFVNEPITNCAIYYSQNSLKGYFHIITLLYKNRNHTFYINGLFIFRLCFIPAFLCNRIIISPRGMLMKNALGSKVFFKRSESARSDSGFNF
jgi:hypothetical protein